MAGAAWRSLTGAKAGPSLYDLCDPLFRRATTGDPHIAKFYNTALGNPALRPLLRRAGLPELRDPATFAALRTALTRARDDVEPDWTAIGGPIADLLETLQPRHPRPQPVSAPTRMPRLSEIDAAIRRCGAHLLDAHTQHGFIPTYAAFNLIGDPDVGGRELLMALNGLRARGYKNSTLLFSLARIFIARSPAAAWPRSPSRWSATTRSAPPGCTGCRPTSGRRTGPASGWSSAWASSARGCCAATWTSTATGATTTPTRCWPRTTPAAWSRTGRPAPAVEPVTEWV